MPTSAALGRDAAVHEERDRWLVLVYQSPAQPVRLRATIRRRLEALGAIDIRRGIAAAPDSPSAETALRTLHSFITGAGGVSYLFRGLAPRQADRGLGLAPEKPAVEGPGEPGREP